MGNVVVRLDTENLNDESFTFTNDLQLLEEENNSAENLRRIARSLSGRAVGHAHGQVRSHLRFVKGQSVAPPPLY